MDAAGIVVTGNTSVRAVILDLPFAHAKAVNISWIMSPEKSGIDPFAAVHVQRDPSSIFRDGIRRKPVHRRNLTALPLNLNPASAGLFA